MSRTAGVVAAVLVATLLAAAASFVPPTVRHAVVLGRGSVAVPAVPAAPQLVASPAPGLPVRLTTSPAEDQLPSISPDGSRIAFISQGRDNPGQDLFLMGIDGSAQTNLSCDPSFPDDSWPCRTKFGLSSSAPPYLGWSPDGAVVAYSQDAADPQFASDIWLAEADGGGKQNITASATGTIDRSPTFSPDARHIHFERSRNPSSPPGDSSFYSVMDADGTDRRDVRGVGTGGIPHWRLSADGFERVFGCIGACVGGVRLMDADGSNDVQVTSDPSDNDPILSPDGTRIVFARGGSETDLFIVSADGTDLRQLTTTPGVYETPTAWSIDGRHIAIEATDTSTGLADVVILDLETDLTHVIGTAATNEWSPSFSPDGRLVVYTGDTLDEGNQDIYLVELFPQPVDPDETPPTIAVGTPADEAVFEQGADVPADFSCVDDAGGTGIAFCSGSTADGIPLDTSALGTYEFQVVASDFAGHRLVETRSFSVVEPLGPGDLDPSFSANGFTLTPFEQSSDPSIDVIEGFGLLPGGRLVASGSSRDTSGQSNVVVAVYDEDGELDPSFGGDGKILVDLGADDEGDGVAYQPGRGIVVGGYSSGELIVLRFELDGDLDPTFGGGDGIVKFAPLGEFGYAWKTAIDQAGRIVVAGQLGSNGDILVARFEDDGDLDPTFGGGDGIARADMGTSEYASSLTFDADGRIVVTGTGNNGFHVYRFTDGGTLDPTFAGDGVATVDIAGSEVAIDAAVDAGGRIVAVGTSDGDLLVARFEEDGDLDPTFDVDGVKLIGLSPAGSDQGNDVSIQADGRIVLAGVAGTVDGGDFAVLRLLADGSLDASFSDDGRAVNDLGGQDWANEMAIDGEGRIVVAGLGGPDQDFAVARYLAASPPDTESGTADPDTGGSASTGTEPTPEDPIETTVIVPGGTAGGPISITESDVSTLPPPSGYDLLGQEIQITAPAGTQANPLHLVFLFDLDLAAAAGVDENTIQVLRNGVPVAGCTATGPISPDPCISARSRTAQSDIQLDVLTSQASIWSAARREQFAFTGFLQPVDNLPTLNRTKAGATVPVKFSLGGNQGLDVLAATYPRSVVIECSSTAPIDALEQTSAASSGGISYDSGTGTYTYAWKTDKSWAGKCRQLVLQFADGSFKRASFDFRR